MPELLLPGNIISMDARAADRLTACGNGDAALLYLLAGGMTGLLPNAILLVCLIAVDGYLLWSALRTAPAVEAPPSPGQKAPLCRVGWTCLRILAAAGLLVLFLKDLLPLWAVFLLLGVMILLMVLIAWRFCRCPRCGGRLRERDVGAEGICPHCGARL